MMTHEALKAAILSKEGAREEYEALAPEFELLHTLLEARQKAGLTQAQVADRMGTKASAVARLESALVNGKHSPSVATLRKYARAVNRRLEIRLVA
jgi:DNA-binding XRE family transcriptional regulator